MNSKWFTLLVVTITVHIRMSRACGEWFKGSFDGVISKHYLLSCDQYRTVAEAERYCAGLEGQLWCPETKEENDLVWAYLNADNGCMNDKDTWLAVRRGDSDYSNITAFLDMDSWKCTHASAQINNSYTNFAFGEPNNVGGNPLNHYVGETCIAMTWQNYYWYDVKCVH